MDEKVSFLLDAGFFAHGGELLVVRLFPLPFRNSEAGQVGLAGGRESKKFSAHARDLRTSIIGPQQGRDSPRKSPGVNGGSS